MTHPTLFAIALAASAVYFSSCASSSKARVVELENGQSASIGTATKQPEAVVAAIDEAQKFCSASQKKAIFKESPEQAECNAFRLDQLPVIGRVFENEPKAVMQFACR